MTSEEEPVLPPEYTPNVLVVMARGCCQGLRAAAGGAVSVAELNLPAGLTQRLGEWSEALSRAVAAADAPDRRSAISAFSTEGVTLARAVQASLGDAYEILYFDEAKLEADGYLTDYLYPIGRSGPA